MDKIILQNDIENADKTLEPLVKELQGLFQLWNIFNVSSLVAQELLEKK